MNTYELHYIGSAKSGQIMKAIFQDGILGV